MRRFKKKLKEDTVSLPNPLLLFSTGKTVIFRLEDYHEVVDECDDYADQEYALDDDDRPEIPLHYNCQCYWEDGQTGANLGQDLLFSS